VTVFGSEPSGGHARAEESGRSELQGLRARAEAACGRISPLWPLEHFVASNPYEGFMDRPFWDADQALLRIAGSGLCMPRRYYREQWAAGRITERDLREALEEWKLTDDPTRFRNALEEDEPPHPRSVRLVTDLLDAATGKDWSGFVVEQMSHFCAAYFDEGQSLWPFPWKGNPFFEAWRAYTALDKSARVFGVRGLAEALEAMPREPVEAVSWAIDTLAVPTSLVDDYLHAALLSVGGWAAWARYRLWRAELTGGDDETLRSLLAIRLGWDALLYRTRVWESADLRARWERVLEAMARASSAHGEDRRVDRLFQTALEIGYRRTLVETLASAPPDAEEESPPLVQAVFCIDVRSEIFRRALEATNPGIRTLGYPGFFGIAKEYRAFADTAARGHLPVFLTPEYRVCEDLPSAAPDERDGLARRRGERRRLAKLWKTFRTSAASCFTFVEVAGLGYAPKLLTDALGWTRPVPSPERAGLLPSEIRKLRLRLDPHPDRGADAGPRVLSTDERADLAARILKTMSLTRGFAPVVLLVGHASPTVNNPQASGLDCGACGGYSGEVSARVAASLFNDPSTRAALRSLGIGIPEETIFVAALHDTVTDTVRILEKESLPTERRPEIERIETWLDAAGRTAAEERARRFGPEVLTASRLRRAALRRSRDWAETRPEWGLARNAAFVAAPRRRTKGRVLAGRAFLHEYDWREDPDGSVLRLIMTAPARVALWINLQYFGSMVDNGRWGSGNKVLHNVVGGSLGVLEGNGGDLRTGLALQSLHDGERWVHEPLRLNVVVDAPEDLLEGILATEEVVRTWVEHEWGFLYRLDDEGRVFMRRPGGGWKRLDR
jgi:uncharacterized protein YbcC (UPF0753/DUF2309 family)